MKQHHIPQYEFNWDKPEGFQLVAETAPVDYEQVAREQRQREIERKRQEKKQNEFSLG